MSYTIGIDVGGTKVLGGVVDASGKILIDARRDTPREGGAALTQTIADVARELMASYSVESVGISAAGFVSSDRKTMLATPNIAGWNGVDLDAQLTALLGLPVVIENDANAAMWAEYKFGSAKGFNPVMFFIIGTGMGGGLVIDGKLFRGANGIGAEFGHMIVQPKGILCGCGAHGCIEQYASGSALMRYAKDAITADPIAGKALLDAAGGINNLTGEILTEAAKNGDQLAISAFNKQADWLGSACASYTLLLDPQAIVVGGGVVGAGELFLAPVRAAMEKYMPFAGTHLLPKVIAAKFGNDAGVIGAADLVRG